MGNLRRFTIVGTITTVLDVALFLVLVQLGALAPWAADALAVTGATVISWTLHTLVTFPADPSQRWYRSAGPYVATALTALLLSVVTVALASAAFSEVNWMGLLVMKLAALVVAFLYRVGRYRNSMFMAIRSGQSHPVRRPPAPGSVRLSVVLPAFNEADRIGSAVRTVEAALGPIRGDGGLEIIVVDDGSADETATRAEEAGADRVITHDENRGKGAAVRSGALAARGRTVAFTDADLSYPPGQIIGMLVAVEDGWDVVVGSRQHSDTTTVVRAGRLRELGGRVINLLSAYVLLGRYRDTQCGLKAFRSDAAEIIFSHTRVDGFAFDIEVFALVERYRLALLEVPVTLENSERSTVRVAKDAARLIRDLFRIRRFARAGLYEASENWVMPDFVGPEPGISSETLSAGELGSNTVSDLVSIFKAYDVRGVVPDQFDPSLARAIGVGFARFLLEVDGPEAVTRVLVARDMRPSGVEMTEAFIDGVTSQGLDAVTLGLTSTDLLYFAAGSLDAPGAMFTASHNPAQYNGIKFCRSGARPVGEETGLSAIRGFAQQSLDGQLADAEQLGSVESMDLLEAFASHVHSFVDVASLAPLKVVADTANGMGGLIAPAVFQGLPFDVEVMYGELDGTFPNHPADPMQPENTADLRARVVDAGADVGLAFDGDADRVFLIDELGNGLSGSTTTAIIAASILDKAPGESVIHNLICSKAVPEVIREHGGTPIRTRVGHSFIKEVMAETGAVFGGEHSAHYYFRKNFRADSGIIAALVVLEQMSVTGRPLSALRKPFERYSDSGEINTTVADTKAVIDRVADHYAEFPQDTLDGLTVDCGDWWFNLRPSNTEPLLRLNLEASDEESCRTHVEEVRSLFS